MVTAQELYDEMQAVEKQVGEVVEKLENTRNKWYNRLYLLVVRLLSIVSLGLAFYCAFYGMAGAAAVMVFLFLMTWVLFLIGYFGVQFATGLWKGIAEQQKSKLNKVRLS